MRPVDRNGGRQARGDERGQASVLVIGFVLILGLGIAVVVDATAAYVHRQSLSTLADGAALRGADLGATGEEVYQAGVGEEPLELTTSAARSAVARYLQSTGAYRSYPGLSYSVSVDRAAGRVTVRLSAPVDLPFSMPGSAEHPRVGATGSAIVDPDDT